MIVFWMLLGVLVCLTCGYVYLKFHTRSKMSAGACILAIISILWGAFTIAWAIASIAEREMQAAGMGVLVFGAVLLILVAVTRKLVSSSPKLQADNKISAG